DCPGAAVRAAIVGGGVPRSGRGEDAGGAACVPARRRRAGAPDQAPVVRRRVDARRGSAEDPGRAAGVTAAVRGGAGRSVVVGWARADSQRAENAARVVVDAGAGAWKEWRRRVRARRANGDEDDASCSQGGRGQEGRQEETVTRGRVLFGM